MSAKMKRTTFLSATSAAVAATSLRANAAQTLPAAIKPPRLRAGDTIGLIAPAGALDSAKDVQHAIDQVGLLGLRAVVGKHALDKNAYLAGTDAARAEDFNTFVRDPQIRGIFALRGGYGTMRILEAIDYDALRRDPKVLLGFSDLTALLNAITLRTGLVTFHGPVAAYSTFTAAVVQNIVRAAMSGEPLGTLKNDTTFSIVGGTARGRLVGGNLTLVSLCAATPYAVPMNDAIVLLEDVHEEPYHIDGMLTSLMLAGDLQTAAGIACGVFMEPNRKQSDEPSPELAWLLQDRLTAVGRPAVRGMQFGHILNQWVLPLGLPATLDTTAGTLTISESATG